MADSTAMFRSSDGRSIELAVTQTSEGIELDTSLVPLWVMAWNLDLQVTIDGAPIVLSAYEIREDGRRITRFVTSRSPVVLKAYETMEDGRCTTRFIASRAAQRAAEALHDNAMGLERREIDHG